MSNIEGYFEEKGFSIKTEIHKIEKIYLKSKVGMKNE